MKYLLLLLCLCSHLECSSVRRTSIQQTTNTSIPQLLVQYPLPAIPSSIQKGPSEIHLALLINEDGSVAKVRILEGSINTKWDSLASMTIKQWRFLPPRIKEGPSSIWIHMQSPLHYTKPLYISLAEILCATKEEADSVHKALELGQDFNELALQYSIDPTRENRGELGKVNIYCYPEYVRQPLLDLEKDEFTLPIKYGDNYVIFKRKMN